MSAEIQTEHRPAASKLLVSEILESRRHQMLEVAEVVSLAGSCLVFALVLMSYIYFFIPARSRLASLNVDLKQTQTNLQTLDTLINKDQTTKQTVDRAAASLDKFETDHLMRVTQGRMDLYEELNQLIVKNNVRNTSGPTYTTLDPAGTKANSGKTAITKWQSFYPGLAVMVTVEGEYQNVRRFIRDVERSKQFVVINEVELQRASQNNAPASAEEGGGSRTRGSLGTLQLNMATYFQRPGAADNASATQE